MVRLPLVRRLVHRWEKIHQLLFVNNLQLFYSFFKTLVGQEIAVELKNDVVLTGGCFQCFLLNLRH
jgi:hypothetical protein